MRNIKHTIIGICSLWLVSIGAVTAQSVTVDLNTEYQSISGFGGVNKPEWIDDLSEDQVDKAFGNNPGQIGLTILRIAVPRNPSGFFREVPTAVLAKNHGAIIVASPWSPPVSLKSNNYHIGGYLLPENYGAYADHLLEFASYMNNNGAPLYAISVQNEPDCDVDYESCDWTAQQFVDFLTEQGSKFDTLNVIAAESQNFDRTLTDPILNDAEAVQHVDIIGGHLYGGGLYDYPLARTKGKEVWMTEHLTGNSSPEVNNWALALNLAKEINDCMIANFSAYIWWYLVRFYSPIDEAGNITKKGYVMSQFSKFIRPGARRIEALVESATNIEASAYKTDTSLVIVVINMNYSSIDLEFTIQNGSIDTLTKFTTSATKNIVNDGGVSISDSIFNATVDSRSITTFSSYTLNAGKYGNIMPVADAGPDVEVDDTDENGSETVMLDGTGSTDPDGAITNYSWSLNGFQVAWEPTYEVDVYVGEYEVILTVTDDDGATHSDTMYITVNSLNNTEIWLETECGQVGSTWNIPIDANASNGRYITVPAGIQRLASPSADTNDLLLFNFHLPEDGTYKIWGRVITPTANDDSFWVRMDDSTWALWNSIPAGSTWHWDDVHDQNNSDQVVICELDTGYHTLTICFREDGARLDKIFLANTGVIPSGIGDTAENYCEVTTIGNTYNEISSVLVFPNPAENEIQVRWNSGFNSLLLIGMDGRKILHKKYAAPLQSINLNLNLEKGIYFLVLRNDKISAVSKLTIE